MLGPVDYFFWLTSFLLEACVVVLALFRRQFLRYFSLNLYMLATAVVTAGQYLVITKFGYASLAYRYYYYYSDSLLTVLLFLVIMALYQQVFGEMQVSRYLRVGAVLLLAGTAVFSYLVVQEHKDHLTSRFVVELSQNLYFVGLVLTYLLWGAVLKLQETRTRIVHLVLSLGIFFSAYASAYALHNLFPEYSVLRWVSPLVGAWLPLAWAYTFTRVPEEARLAPARVATARR